MRYCVYLAVILFSGLHGNLYSGNGQPVHRSFDSLYRYLLSGNPDVKAAECLELAGRAGDTMPVEVFRLIQRAQVIAIQSNDPEMKARAKLALADYYSGRSKYKLAHENYIKARRMFCYTRDTVGVIEAYKKLGKLNLILDNPEKSRDCFRKGMNLAEQAGLYSQLASLLMEDGKVLQFMNNLTEAGIQFRKGLIFARRSGDREMKDQILVTMGMLYLDKRQYSEAIHYYQSLLMQVDTNGPSMGALYTRLAHAWMGVDQAQKSLYYNHKALASRQKFNDLSGVASSEINIGGDFYALFQPDSAIYHLEKGIRLAKRGNYVSFISNAIRHNYEYYLRSGDFRTATDIFKNYCRQVQGIENIRKRSHIELMEAVQKIDSANESTKALIEQARIVQLSQVNSNYQAYTVKGFIILASIILIIIFLQYYFTIINNRKEQMINLQLSVEKEERFMAEQEIGEKEKQYRFMTENSIDFITQMDQNLKRTYASPSAERVYGYTPEEMLEKSPYEVTHPDFHTYAEEKAREMVKSRLPVHLILQAVKKDGRYFWIESILNPLFDSESGEFRGMVGVTRDIQELKNKEIAIMEGTKQKENLLKEIHHRVKNNFAILVSLINMQMAQTKNQELLQSLTNLQLRIRAMALVHEMLYRSKDFENISFSEYLRSVCSVIAGTYNRRNVQLTFEADDAVMDIESSIPLGLIVNELLSNAYKHAFSEDASGDISVRFINDAKEGVYKLVISDNGIGMPPGIPVEQYTTMGLQIVQILCRQIEGQLTQVNDPGAKFTIEFRGSVRG